MLNEHGQLKIKILVVKTKAIIKKRESVNNYSLKLHI